MNSISSTLVFILFSTTQLFDLSELALIRRKKSDKKDTSSQSNNIQSDS